MVVKEEISLLPSSVKGATEVKERRMSIKRSFHWLQIATLALIIGWLALLSVRSWQPVLSEEVVNELLRGQEVRDSFLEYNRSSQPRHVKGGSMSPEKPQLWKATLSSVTETLLTLQTSMPPLPTLIVYGREVW